MLDYRETQGIMPVDAEKTLGICYYGGIEEILRVFDEEKQVLTDEIREKKIIIFSERQQRAITVYVPADFDHEKVREDEEVKLVGDQFRIWANSRTENDIKVNALGLEVVKKGSQPATSNNGQTDQTTERKEGQQNQKENRKEGK